MKLGEKTKYVEQFKDLFFSMDEYRSGKLSFAEFEDHLDDPQMQAYFAHLNLDVVQGWDLFRLLDCDHSGLVSVDEFVNGCLRLRGPAKSFDLFNIHHDVAVIKRKLEDFMKFTHRALEVNAGELKRRSMAAPQQTVVV